jgi:hypothetical protein
VLPSLSLGLALNYQLDLRAGSIEPVCRLIVLTYDTGFKRGISFAYLTFD